MSFHPATTIADHGGLMIRKTLLMTGALIACALGAPASAGSLTTSFTTDNSGRSGLYFDLTANENLEVTSWVVDSQAGDNWSVYYKTGTYSGFETDASAWTLLGTGNTTNPIDTLNVGGLFLPANQTIGVYIFDNTGYQSYNDGTATYSNADLTFSGGTGNYGELYGVGPFTNTLDYRIWAGTVNYTAGIPEPATWAMMLIGLGGLGMALRSRRRPSSLGATA